jgi:hypothetical protein
MIAMGDAFLGSPVRVPRPPAPRQRPVAADGAGNRWGMPGPFRLTAATAPRTGGPRLVFAAPAVPGSRLAAA